MQFQRIRDLREDKDLNQKSIAEYLGIGMSTYQRYERGELQISLENTVMLAKFYGVSIDYIAGLTNDKRGLTRSDLSDSDSDLIKKFHSLSEKSQGYILGQIDLLSFSEDQEHIQKEA